MYMKILYAQTVIRNLLHHLNERKSLGHERVYYRKSCESTCTMVVKLPDACDDNHACFGVHAVIQLTLSIVRLN